MAHWFTFAGGCTEDQATELDALARALDMGEGAGLILFAKAQACAIEKARHCMSIDRAESALEWAREHLADATNRRAWRAS